MEKCPICGSKGIGKVGAGHYFCRECCLEFIRRYGHITAYRVEDDGSLSQYYEQDASLENIS